MYKGVKHRAFFIISSVLRLTFTTLNSVPILPDVAFMRRHVEVCVNFWDMVQQGVLPPAVDGDYKTLRAKGATALVRQLASGDNSAMNPLKEMMTEDLMKCAGMYLIRDKDRVLVKGNP